ncbi:hypothetical protein BurMR1_0605 [Burkholderia sp. MR1]|nr:hypothetical protein BurMR1_0605 [Burkholderia sp. MR1]
MSRLIFRRKVKTKSDAKPFAPAADDTATSPVQEPPDPGKAIRGWLWKPFGWVGVFIIGCAGVWWQWDHISKLPGIDVLVARVSEKSLPKAEAGRFNIAIAHLVGDDDRSMQQVIRTSLIDKFPVANTVSFDRLISTEDEHQGHERAQALLKDSGFDVMVWGDCLKTDGKSLPRLHLTVSRDARNAAPGGVIKQLGI